MIYGVLCVYFYSLDEDLMPFAIQIHAKILKGSQPFYPHCYFCELSTLQKHESEMAFSINISTETDTPSSDRTLFCRWRWMAGDWVSASCWVPVFSLHFIGSHGSAVCSSASVNRQHRQWPWAKYALFVQHQCSWNHVVYLCLLLTGFHLLNSWKQTTF